MAQPSAAIGSLYESEASPAPDCPALSGAQEADVAVIGGGLSGISTALHLAKRGVRVAVLEAHRPGWGASGRNGGQVNPGLKLSPDEVERHFGPEFGPKLVDCAWNAPDLVFDLVREYGLSCDAAQGGTLRAATGRSQIAPLRDLLAQCERRGWPVTWLDAAAMRARTGTGRYLAGMDDARGGQVDPLAFTLGLAGAAVREGARLFGDSPVTAIERAGEGWRLRAPGGTLSCGRIVIATNGYSGPLFPALRRSVVPVYSAIVASAPLPPATRERILAGREVVYELGRITAYYRVDGKGRLLMGGRSFSRPASGVKPFRSLIAHARRTWPGLADIAWTHGWNGQIAMTRDHLPHWHEPAPGLFAMLGYNGRGVAMATLAGREMARYLTGQAPPLFPFSPVAPIAFHRFWPAGVAAAILWGRLRDRLSGS